MSDGNRHRTASSCGRADATRPRSHRYRTAVIAGLIGFVLSFAAAFAVGLRERSIAEMEFAAAAQRHAMALQNGVNEYVSRLKALRTFFETAGDKITRSEFELLGARLFGDHPGLLRVTWAPSQRACNI